VAGTGEGRIVERGWTGMSGESTELAVGAMHGFAPALTSFVGRVKDVDALAGLLGRHRLVTVAGPGGAGKSRLAAEIAARVAGRFVDGAWLVELAAVRDPGLVPAVVATTLGIPEQAGLPAADALARVLAGQQLLLVLDNCEQVIGAAAELCARLLAACDDVRLLATSQEPLRVAGEARYRLRPLSLPGPDDAAGADCEAAVLFADRARHADAHFELDEETSPAVARLVRRLDGMPLAIELAAAQVESLGVTQLLDRIDDLFGLLSGADRLAPSRQQSLAATVEWSYRLLDEPEQRVFRLVSVFPGPFTLGAAEAVAGDGAGKALLRLVDCSLVVPPRPGPDGESRYPMLDTLRAYGAGRLTTAGEQPAAAATLAGYALRAAEQAASGLETSSAEVSAARLLDAEDATMQQALAWSMEHDPATGVRLALALAPWWFLRGRLASESLRLRQAAEHTAAGSDAWCAAQFWLGYTALLSADLPGALDRFTALRDAREDQPASPALAAALAGRSLALTYLSRPAEAENDGRRSLALAWAAGDPTGQARALVNLSSAAYAAGDTEEAARLAWQAQQIQAEVPGSIARAGSNILTMALTELGDLEAAERICTVGLTRSREAGDLWSLARLLTQLAALDVRAGRTADAAAHLREALQAAWRAGGLSELLGALDGCGHLCAATGQHAEALTVWAAHAALARREGHADRPPAARHRRESRADAARALKSAEVAAAEERGAAMSLATAVEYGLMLTAAGPPQAQAAPPLDNLSARERELVTLVARGSTDMQIAAQLFISVSTVRSHLDRIRDKTGCRKRADLTRLALGAGLV
jgi:predicted ATPase/DNA-binding CsgD family transcriptional regulator